MPDVVLARFKPQPGQRADELEIPGPGLYEADFKVPDWLVPDLKVTRSFTFKVQEHTIEHISTGEAGGVLTVRFRVISNGDVTSSSPQTEALFLGLTLGVIARGVFAVVLGALAAYLVSAIVDGIREVRKIAETPAGIGLAVLGIGAGVALLVGSLRGGG